MARTSNCSVGLVDAELLLRQDRLELAAVRDLLVAVRAESIFGSLKAGGVSDAALGRESYDTSTATAVGLIASGIQAESLRPRSDSLESSDPDSLSSDEMLALLSDDDAFLFDDASVTIASACDSEDSLNGSHAHFLQQHSFKAITTSALTVARAIEGFDCESLQPAPQRTPHPRSLLPAASTPSSDLCVAYCSATQLPARPRKRKRSNTLRVRPKAKLEILRREVADLEERLRQLAGSREAQADSEAGTNADTDLVHTLLTSATAQTHMLLESWEVAASHQMRLRAEAEAENARLRASLQAQAVISRQLANVLIAYPVADE